MSDDRVEPEQRSSTPDKEGAPVDQNDLQRGPTQSEAVLPSGPLNNVGELRSGVKVNSPVKREIPSVAEIFRVFLIIGVSAYGMAIMQSIRSVPVRRGWMTKDDIDEGLGLVQLYPGAMMVDLVAYIGYRMKRIRGSLAAVIGFVSPSLLLLIALSWAYFTYGAHPEVRNLVVGLGSLVVGVLLSVTVDFAAQHARQRTAALVALGAFIIAATSQNVLWAVLLGALVGAAVDRTRFSLAGQVASDSHGAGTGVNISWRRIGLAIVPGVIVAVIATMAALGTTPLAAVSADMAKIGAVAFGNGTAIMPVLQQDALAHHWLNLSQFEVGIGFGQVTPGPFLSTASFIGYAAAGWLGAVAGGVAIYAPSVAMTMVVAEIYPWLRRLGFVRGAIAGVMASFTGLLFSMVVTLAKPLVSVPVALIFAGGAFVASRIFKLNVLLIFVVGIAIWALYLFLGGNVT